jgi:hypothetical protein
MHAPQKPRLFPMNFKPRAARRYIHFQNAPHCTCTRKPKNTRFPRENRTFPVSSLPSRASNLVQYALQAPIFDQSKTHVSPEKYAPHLNSVLSGSSYLQKTPCFPVPNASKTPFYPQKTKNVVYASGGPSATLASYPILHNPKLFSNPQSSTSR